MTPEEVVKAVMSQSATMTRPYTGGRLIPIGRPNQEPSAVCGMHMEKTFQAMKVNSGAWWPNTIRTN